MLSVIMHIIATIILSGAMLIAIHMGYDAGLSEKKPNVLKWAVLGFLLMIGCVIHVLA